MNLTELQGRVAKARKIVDARIVEARLLATQGKSLAEEIELLDKDIELYKKVAITLGSIGETRQSDAQHTIEELVTRGLTTIFNEELSFHVVQTQRGKTPEVKFLVKSRGLNGRTVETSVMDARGGGLAAVVGFLLRLIVLLLDPAKKSRVLVLDESFSHVSAEYERPLAEFLKELVDRTNTQIVMITHSEAYREFADVRYRLELKNGVTVSRQF